MKRPDDIVSKPVNHELYLFMYNTNCSWKSPFTFIQMADTQFGLTDSDDTWDIEMKYTNKCIDLINKMQPIPKFAIVCGDMINSFPFKRNRKEQVSDFYKIFQGLHPEVPLICVCGNHDIGNAPTPTTIAEYRNDFGEDYMKFWVDGVKFLVINSQYIFDSSQCPNEAAEHEMWLDRELTHEENINAKHFIVFQHIPWFNSDSEERDNYFSIPLYSRIKWLDKLCKAGVTKVFAGHLHYNFTGTYRSKTGAGSLDIIVTTAIGLQLGKDNHGFRIVTVNSKDVSHELVSLILD